MKIKSVQFTKLIIRGIIYIMGVDVLKVSVIVHVYNTERYLQSNLNYLSNQSLKDLEIIVVNNNYQVIVSRF